MSKCELTKITAEIKQSEDRGDGERTENYQKLLENGLDEKVAAKLDDIFKTGQLSHADLDERALSALKEFTVDDALEVLCQFRALDLELVSYKSPYLCGVMNIQRQKNRARKEESSPVTAAAVNGVDDNKITKILERTGYSLQITSGQRKYGGPPPNWDGPTPGKGCEIFCGKIPKDMLEDELVPLFEKCGTIWDFRLMMDPVEGKNRGFAFLTYTTPEAALKAVRQLDNYEIKAGKFLKLNISIPNHRLFVANIPKSKDKDEILVEFSKLTAGLTEVIIYNSPDDNNKNRGFCFLEYGSYKEALLAKRRLGTRKIKVWGCDIFVDWADPEEEPDQQVMSKVKVLYVRNLTQDVTEEEVKEHFEKYGKVDRVKKIKNYAFVHFEDRETALIAMQGVNGKELGPSCVEVTLAKPPSDKKKKEEILRAREHRMMLMIQGHTKMVRNVPHSYPGMMSTTPATMRSPRMRAPIPSRVYNFEHDVCGHTVDYNDRISRTSPTDFWRTGTATRGRSVGFRGNSYGGGTGVKEWGGGPQTSATKDNNGSGNMRPYDRDAQLATAQRNYPTSKTYYP